MTDRYSLRIETGGRAGELVPLSHSPFLIGRSQECNLRLTEASVSGRHAELRIKGALISLHDLGSTNGTRIGRLKVGEAELETGLAFSVGDVRMTLVAAEAPAPAPAKEPDSDEIQLESDEISLEEPEAAPAAPTETFAKASAQTQIQPVWDNSLGSEELLDEAGHVSADQLARASRRSPVALAGLAVLILAAGGAFYFWGQGAGEGAAAPKEATVAGDLLNGAGTFEDSEGSAWSSRDGWSGLFRQTRSAAAAGAGGLACELFTGERAQELGPIIKVPAQQNFQVSASIRTEGDVIARIGLRWSTDEPAGGNAAAQVQATTAWGPVVEGTDGFQDYELKGTAPAGYTKAQVCIAAWGKGERQEGEDVTETVAGRVDVDSVSWLGSGTGQPAVELLEMAGFVPGTSFVLHKIDRVLLSGVQCLVNRNGYGVHPVQLALQP
ncbi:MAG: FHA domain-containing protein, partial [Planctomycetota bacterium]|nr:FHA domain-containing protein [Planctomycetota bacterium]